jgi:ABC-type sugar transport system ATPase subunit
MSTVLTCSGVSKWFGRARVLDAVDFEVRAGEIHALLGENGAGKSTLMKIISGMLQPDSGSISLSGRPVVMGSPTAANEAGVALIHQEPRVFPDLTVIENMWVDDRSSVLRRVFARRQVQDESEARLRELGCNVSLRARMSELSVADQQLVDVASALARDLRVLIVDEPTASLTPTEVAALFTVLWRLRDAGVAIVFIGHRLEEILQISDRITVLRDGAVVRTVETSATDEAELVRLMVGRDIAVATSRQRDEAADVVLEVRGLSSPGVFDDVSLQVRAGQILGLGGLVGAGRTELLETIFGRRRRSGGDVLVRGTGIGSTADAIRNGVALVPEDRARNGLVLAASVRDNLTAPSLGRLMRWGFRRPGLERALVSSCIDSMDIRALDGDVTAGTLSGGNQQKVSVARWLARSPAVLLVDEPTRGVDIGAKSQIHDVLRRLADEGLAVLAVSSDMRELLSISDDIVVMREGSVTGALRGDEATEESVLRLAAGVRA